MTSLNDVIPYIFEVLFRHS